MTPPSGGPGSSCALEWVADSFSWVGERAPYATPQSARGSFGPGSPSNKGKRGAGTLWSTRGLYFQIPRSAWSRLPPGAPAARAQSQETKCPHYCCRQPRLSMREKVHCAPRHLLKRRLFSALSPALRWVRNCAGSGGTGGGTVTVICGDICRAARVYSSQAHTHPRSHTHPARRSSCSPHLLPT